MLPASLTLLCSSLHHDPNMIRNSNLAEILLGKSDYSLSSRSDSIGQNNGILEETNSLLLAVGISAKQISSIEELSRVASSMFVAIYESLFHIRLDDIVRNPQSKDEYVHNAQLVIDGLSEQIQMDLQHITGGSIANGDIRAISHLVNLLTRIVAITRETQVGISVSASEEHFPARASALVDTRQLQSSMDSISTHDSAFESASENESHHQTNSSSENENRKITRKLKYSQTTPVRRSTSSSRVRSEMVDVVNKNALIQSQRDRLMQAQRRREAHTSIRERESSSRNKRRADVSFRTQQKRWLEDEIRSEASHRLLKDSQHSLMLRKVYAGLLKQMRSWKNEEHEEAKRKFMELRENAMWQIRAIQTVFEDRIAMLKEQESQRKLDERVITFANRRLASEVRHSVQEKQQQALYNNKSMLMQERENERERRIESHRSLLALLDSGDWSQSLRNSHSR